MTVLAERRSWQARRASCHRGGEKPRRGVARLPERLARGSRCFSRVAGLDVSSSVIPRLVVVVFVPSGARLGVMRLWRRGGTARRLLRLDLLLLFAPTRPRRPRASATRSA